MKIKLHRRHGDNPAGKTVTYSESMGQWLIDHGFGTEAGSKSSDVEAEQVPDARTPRAATSRRKTTGGDDQGSKS